MVPEEEGKMVSSTLFPIFSTFHFFYSYSLVCFYSCYSLFCCFCRSLNSFHLSLSLVVFQVSATEECIGPMRLTQEPIQVKLHFTFFCISPVNSMLQFGAHRPSIIRSLLYFVMQFSDVTCCGRAHHGKFVSSSRY